MACRVYGDIPATRIQYLESALRYLQPCLRELSTRRLTFLCGAAGPLALASCLYYLLGKQLCSLPISGRVKCDVCTGDASKSHSCISQLKELVHSPASSDLPYEVLYGHAGYLYALLFVGELVPGGLDEALVEQEVMSILDAGQRGSTSDASDSVPLMFTWHGKRYLGAAHGLAGILTVLLQVASCSAGHGVLPCVCACR